MPTATASRQARSRAVLPPTVVVRNFVTETVLLDIESGRYFRLDRAAGEMLDALLSEPTVAAAAGTLAAHDRGPADRLTAELARLCAELEALDLVALEPAA